MSENVPGTTDNTKTQQIAMLPLRQGILFPGSTLAVGIGRRQSRSLVKAAHTGAQVVVAFQRDPRVEDPSMAELWPVGMFAEIAKISTGPGGSLRVALRAQRRCEIHGIVRSYPHWIAAVSELETVNADTITSEALASVLLEKIGELLPEQAVELLHAVKEAQRQRDFGRVADTVTGALGLGSEQEIQVLLSSDVEQRLRLVATFVGEATVLAEVKSKISEEIQKQFGKHQREAVLREQLRAIRKELGAEGDEGDDEDGLRRKLEALDLPTEAREVVDRELRRLGRDGGSGAEQHVIRNYLELIADLPWSERAELSDDIERVAQTLDADHYGLDDVKERILEHLAVEHRVKNHRGAILTLVGPPGVGKTSLGQSIADATGRPFVRIALGGVRDEAEIRGHRRTYVGAMPGRVVSALREVKAKNPLILLDEIDKLGQGWLGSPESALLELLDPEQNRTFTDHYLDLPFDLSEALFLCTANTLQSLSAPLRDRLEIVELKGYTPLEKLAIARRHLLPKKLGEHSLDSAAVDIPDETIFAIVDSYTREAGVRQLARELTRICRAIVLRLARQREEVVQVRVSSDELSSMLGKPRFIDHQEQRSPIPGVATGLAWTPVGGDVLFVESSRMPGKGKIEITGQLGDVMKESARTALSYLRSHARELGIEPELLDDQDVHIHVPAGGVPKDGPSAGITILTALASLFSNRLVRADTAMTGECTLRGRVLPVGGITAKVLAAHRHGVKRVLMSEQNRRDADEIPGEVREQIDLVFVSEVSDVLREALAPAQPFPGSGLAPTREPLRPNL